jgi:hypothetical protein
VEAGATYSFSAETADAEGQGVTVSVVRKPDWLSFSNGVLSGTAPVGGTGLVELLATDSLGAATTLKYQLTVTDGFASYLEDKGLAVGTAFDARVNGVQVGLAYTFGTTSGSPANNGVVAVPTMSGNEMTYVFDRVRDPALMVKAFTSPDLVTWTEEPVVSATVGVTPENFIKQKVVATGVGKLFVKISVTHP